MCIELGVPIKHGILKKKNNLNTVVIFAGKYYPTQFPFFTNEAMKKKSGDDVYSSIIVFFFRYWSNWAYFSDCIVQDEKKNTHITIHYLNAGNRTINREIKFVYMLHIVYCCHFHFDTLSS